MRTTRTIPGASRVCGAIVVVIIIGVALGSAVSAQTNPTKLSPSDYYKTLVQARGQLATGNFAKAAELYERLTEFYPDDPWSWDELGDTRSQLKQYDGAAKAFEKALTLKRDDLLAFDVAFDNYRIARMYGLAGDKKNTLVWLQKAVKAGFERRPELSEDPVFASLRGDPLFAEICGLLPERKFSRDEGWR